MDRIVATPRHFGACRPTYGIADSATRLRHNALSPHDHRASDVVGSHIAASAKATFRRQHAALANLVRPLEPNFAEALANKLLSTFGSLTAVLSEPSDGLAMVTGNHVLADILSSTKDVVVQSLLAELPREPFSPANQNVIQYLSALLGSLTHEEAHAFFLDRNLGFLRHEVFAYGSDRGATFPVRVMLRRAVQIGATQLVLIHNHPSGIAKPSESDIAATRDICAASKAVDIGVYDHLIVAGPHLFSFRSAGLI
jgi:DNA repair protein RadC